MGKESKWKDIPEELAHIIASNGEAMGHFYGLSPEKRQNVLDSISETNKRLEKYKD